MLDLDFTREQETARGMVRGLCAEFSPLERVRVRELDDDPGGIGFTVEYDIHIYFRRAEQLQLPWWDQAACEDRIAGGVLGPA